MRCLHCGTSAGKARADELSHDEAIALIDELAELGTDSITISGGEPLLRKDWRDLARHMKKRDVKPYIITNGFAVTPEIVQDMKEIGFTNIGVSLDGTESTHNYIRQNKNSFPRAVNAMRLMDEAGVRFCAITQVSNINLAELDAIRDILLDVHCPAWRIQMTTPTGRMPREMVLSLDNYPVLIDKILEYQKLGGIDIDVGENVGYFGCKGTELLDGQAYFGCYAGTRVAGVESNGDIKGCLSMPEEFVEGNVRDGGFTKIWNNPDGFAYNRKFTRETADGACRECEYLPLCRGGCATTSWAATKSRANNPYCIYQIEKQQGITPPEHEGITELLQRFAE
jgi:radical SAM protein with 4Fe4S-binding SPASM domain